MAEAFLNYAQNGCISMPVQHRITDILKQGLVYQYFQLPLSIMKADIDAIKHLQYKYQWIDFSYTVKQYKKFLDSISIFQQD